MFSANSEVLQDSHWQAAVRVLRYLAITLEHQLSFRGDIKLVGYSDADWAGDIDSRWSTSGYCFVLGSSLIFLEIKEAKLSSISLTESECRAYFNTCCELLWLMQLLYHIGV